MSVGHLLFAAVTTTYILVAIQLEEHDLLAADRTNYQRYRAETRMLIPIPKSRRDAAKEERV
jgi:protein-S-isoprenylcysteine O-methyltransferase Ste14